MDQAGNRPADDFTVLPGIGSAINRRLHDAGIGVLSKGLPMIDTLIRETG